MAAKVREFSRSEFENLLKLEEYAASRLLYRGIGPGSPEWAALCDEFSKKRIAYMNECGVD